MEEKQITVTKEEQFATYRQVVYPPTQEAIPEVVTTLIRVYREGKITGSMTIAFNQGGVRNIVADQTARVPAGSVQDQILEELFGK